METKPWYTSKGVWATALTTLVSVYVVVATNIPALHLPPIDAGILGTILSVLGSLGLYSRVTATTGISK